MQGFTPSFKNHLQLRRCQKHWMRYWEADRGEGAATYSLKKDIELLGFTA
jgi:hypothetical protein